MILRPPEAWKSAERVLQLRVLAALGWLLVCAVACLAGEDTRCAESLNAAAAYLAIAGVLHALSRWSRTTHGSALATLVLFDAPTLAAMQWLAMPFEPGAPMRVVVSVWFFAFLLLAAALTLSRLAVSALAMEATLLQAALMSRGNLSGELTGVTMAIFCALAGLAVLITVQLERAVESARRE